MRYLVGCIIIILLASACTSTRTPSETPVGTPTGSPTRISTPTPFQIQEHTNTPSPSLPMITPSPTMKPLPFVLSDQDIGSGHSWDIALGDLDGDGDLDAFVANSDQGEVPNEVWLNDGSGIFTLKQQLPGFSKGVSLGDLDGDGDLDAITTNWWGQVTSNIWINDGTSIFTDSGQDLDPAMDSALGDLDGDGDLDLFLAKQESNSIWLNDGNGSFTDRGIRLGSSITAGVALEDLDYDGDLDALTAGWDEPAKVWLNDGQGVFTRHEQILCFSSIHVHGLALGDLDGDGDLDTFMAIASNHPNQVWFNDGSGGFTNSNQPLQSPLTQSVVLGDLDRDGDLDAVTAHGASRGNSGGRIWLNDGTGRYSDSGNRLGDTFSSGLALGDLDGDGDLDIILAHGETWREQGGELLNEIWINESP